jgi:hypothetical protein
VVAFLVRQLPPPPPSVFPLTFSFSLIHLPPFGSRPFLLDGIQLPCSSGCPLPVIHVVSTLMWISWTRTLNHLCHTSFSLALMSLLFSFVLPPLFCRVCSILIMSVHVLDHLPRNVIQIWLSPPL